LKRRGVIAIKKLFGENNMHNEAQIGQKPLKFTHDLPQDGSPEKEGGANGRWAVLSRGMSPRSEASPETKTGRRTRNLLGLLGRTLNRGRFPRMEAAARS